MTIERGKMEKEMYPASETIDGVIIKAHPDGRHGWVKNFLVQLDREHVINLDPSKWGKDLDRGTLLLHAFSWREHPERDVSIGDAVQVVCKGRQRVVNPLGQAGPWSPILDYLKINPETQ